MSNQSLASVLARLKLLTGSDTDVQLARALEVSPQTLSSWKVRDSIPYSLCVSIARKHECTLDWLLMGETQNPSPAQTEDGWENDVLERLRSLSSADRQAIFLHIEDKHRIQRLEQQLHALAQRAPGQA
ncbi:helix-turn-helix domain-containing protein [Pseudomonas sp. NPDC087029]|uniref:helix-turn-helix domain-containing protein n=1 Tax=Pseudomonas sp. NPDC087029 TaxID=3364433 RepID=UPI0037F7121B